MSYDIKDKIVFITGANRGIGKALVDSFIEYGVAKVYAAVRNLDSVSPLVAKYAEKVIPIYIDLADPQSIATAAETTKDVQVVINNAGVLSESTPFDDETISSLELEMKVNVYGLIYMARNFAPILKANGGGVFVQLNSIASMKNFPNFTTYCTSKAAAYSVTQSLRELLRDQGTIVVSVHPGPIATDMADAAGMTEIAEPPSLVAHSIMEALKMGNFHAFPDSIAKRLGNAYQSFAESVVEVNLSEGEMF